MLEQLGETLRHVIERVAELQAGHADLEARIERLFRKGKVTDVDATKHLYRQEIGLDDDGQPVKSPWLPYSQRAGARKEHSPPSVGEQYLLINPDGGPDFTMGLGLPHGWYNENPSPSTDPASDVTVRGNVTETTTANDWTLKVSGVTLKVSADGLQVSAGDVTHKISSAGVETKGGLIKHDSLHIGSDHVHTDVTPGAGLSGVPQ